MGLTEGQIRYRKYRKTYLVYSRNNGKKYRDKLLFDGNRIKALKRDGYKCVYCGMTRKEHKKKYGLDITVDHIDGQGRYSKIKNNDLSNLQTLCLSCHGKKDIERSFNTHPRPIGQFSMDGKLINTFSSSMEAQRMGFHNSSVTRTARGFYPHYKGFLWKFI